jgi:glutathione synthase/RimK-type ligase-like ATP-grasp enzyme
MSKENLIIIGLNYPSIKSIFGDMTEGTLITRGYSKKKKKHFHRIYRNHEDLGDYIGSYSYPNTLSNSLVIRWGSREEFKFSNSTVLNKSRAIAGAGSKAWARDAMFGKGIAIPKKITPANYKKGSKIIVRPHQHSKGKDFIVIDNYQDLHKHYNPTKYYYSEFIDKEREFRVHCAHGKVLCVMEKPRPKDTNMLAWNLGKEPFEYVEWSKVNRTCIALALAAIKVLGLDFGGVDIIYKKGVYYVLEVNTSPATCPYVANRYARYFDWVYRCTSKSGEIPKHWEFDSFKKGSSMIWKNVQLDSEDDTIIKKGSRDEETEVSFTNH